MNGLKCVVPENIHRQDLPYAPPPLGDFPKSAPTIYTNPSPPEFPKFFAHSSEILLSLIEVNKVVLLARMPNFVSFMYFLLNCITDRQIPYANSLCSQITNKFCEFHVFPVEFYNVR